MSELPNMKVLTWNIRSGGGKNCLQIIDRILAHDPQVVVLTEFQNKNEDILRSGLEQGGFAWIESSNPQDKENGLLVASKFEITRNGSMTHDEDPQRWLSLYLPAHKINLLAVHIPGSPDHKFINGVGISGKARKEMFWRKIIEFAKDYLNDRVIIVGDFNTGFKEDAEGTPFLLSKYMKELLSLGYVDAWRTIHKSKKEYTWYSQHKVNGITVDKNGFRLDYMFLSPTISNNVCDAFHSHQERLEKVSDHSALACHFSFKKNEFLTSPSKLTATNNNQLNRTIVNNHMTIDEVFSDAANRGLFPKRWSGSRLLTYNGFTHEQRVRKWQALDLAIRMGLDNPAEQFPCSVCGAEPSPAIAYHSEDYSSMQGHYPVCRSCHMKIHNRFKNLARWQQFVATVGNGKKWFELINCNDDTTTDREIASLTKSVSLLKPEEAKQAINSTSDKPLSSSGNTRQEMQTIRIAFIKALGIKSKDMNPNPVSGYKLEHNFATRQTNLTEARRLRNVYAEMVKKNGSGQDILDKMDSNLENRDRNAEWK